MKNFQTLLRQQEEQYALAIERLAIEAMRRAGRSPDPTLRFARVQALRFGGDVIRFVDLERLSPGLAGKIRLARAARAPIRVALEELAELERAPAAPAEKRDWPRALLRAAR